MGKIKGLIVLGIILLFALAIVATTNAGGDPSVMFDNGDAVSEIDSTPTLGDEGTVVSGSLGVEDEASGSEENFLTASFLGIAPTWVWLSVVLILLILYVAYRRLDDGEEV